MSNDLVLSNPKAAELLQRARQFANRASAENTTRMYASFWSQFNAFAHRMNADPLPAHPALVVAYLSELAPRQKTSTLTSKLAAIRYYHLKNRLPDPTRDPAVVDVMDGIKNTLGVPPEQKKAIDRTLLQNLLRVQPQTLRGMRNRAILLIGYACVLRRSEIVALKVSSVEFERDRMIVSILRSKTDQRGEGSKIHVPRIADKTMCAVHAVETWLSVSGITAGALFREVDKWEHLGEGALTDQVVKDIVKAAARAAGYKNITLFAAHGLRRGGITEAARNQETTGDIRKVSRHKTERMVDVYAEDAAAAQMRVIAHNLGEE